MKLHVRHRIRQDRLPDRSRRVGAASHALTAGDQQGRAIRADREAIDRVPARARRRRHLTPGRAVGRSEQTAAADGVEITESLAGAGVDQVRIVRVHDNRRHREIGHEVVDRRPRLPAIVGTPDSAGDASGPDGGVVGRMHEDGAGSSTDIAGSERDPLPLRQACDRGRSNRKMGRRHRTAGWHAGHAAAARSQPQTVELAQRPDQWLAWDLPAVVARLRQPEHLPCTWRVRIIQASQCALQRFFRQRLDPRLGKPARRA